MSARPRLEVGRHLIGLVATVQVHGQDTDAFGHLQQTHEELTKMTWDEALLLRKAALLSATAEGDVRRQSWRVITAALVPLVELDTEPQEGD